MRPSFEVWHHTILSACNRANHATDSRECADAWAEVVLAVLNPPATVTREEWATVAIPLVNKLSALCET